MSKKSSVNKPKKSRRRLKRSVRRSLAAVLMITAIGVAAIPVPENIAADPETPGGSTTTTVVGDVHDMKDFVYKESPSTNTTVPNPDPNADIPITTSGSWSLSTYKGADMTTLLAALQDSDVGDDGSKTITVSGNSVKPVYASYKIRDIDNSQTLIWEFMYYLVSDSGTPRGVVCKYNTDFSAKEVGLDSHLITSYYTLSMSDLDAVFSNTGTEGSEDAAHKKAVENLSIDPTEEITLSYDSYIQSIQSGGGLPSDLTLEQWDCLQNYCGTYYKAGCERFDAYKKAYDEALAAWKKGNPDKADSEFTFNAPTNVDKSNLVLTPSNCINKNYPLRAQFYCNYSYDLGTGLKSKFTMVEVYDERPSVSGGNGGEIYVAKGDPKDPDITSTYKTDDSGYLVLEESNRSMFAIGENAFEGVRNVVNMTIPSMIHYIGNEAFKNAGLIESINIGNVFQIGNRAFKGCDHLKTVKLAEGTLDIGVECFSDTAITEIELPSSIQRIGYGAFTNCSELTKVDFSLLRSGCSIGDFAFYNCTALQKVDMTDAVISAIGKGAFASNSGVLYEFIFPQNVNAHSMTGSDSIGDYMFAGCSNLKRVIFPKNYGNSGQNAATLPDNMFHDCTGLEYIEFPADSTFPRACAYVSYNSDKLFADVLGKTLYVKGPEKQGSVDPKDNTDAAYPRKCTWNAVTAESGYKVPYLYVGSDGKEYFELSDGIYLKCVKKNEDGETGILTKCTYKPGVTTGDDIFLKIEAYVGTIRLTGLGDNCFPDKTGLNQKVVSLEIEDDSISEISAEVFKEWHNLESASIGNSVTFIGDRAFAGCEKLEDVTFSSPKIGYDQFKIGTDAFKTGSSRLTFHGDIIKGYAPFEWATDPNNIIETNGGIRVCYKSLAPSYLTVMYNPNTELVTLLDYPKYNQVSQVLDEVYKNRIAEGKFDSYESMREWELYYSDNEMGYYGENWDTARKVFASEWNKIVELESKDVDTSELKKELYESEKYGPWVNPEFCEKWNTDKWLDVSTDNPSEGDDKENKEPSGNEGEDENKDETDPGQTVLNTLTDWLFEPIVAYAADDNNPIPYFSYGEDLITHKGGNHYDVVNNAEKPQNWYATSDEEETLLKATENIDVPAGVDSIDIYGYINNVTLDGSARKADNTFNAQKYLNAYPYSGCWDKDTENMYTVMEHRLSGDNDPLKSVAGLFSGEYDDNCSDENWTRGNDRIRTVKLNSVKYLPDYAFDSCERLKTVELGPDCADIGTAPFRGCSALQTVGGNANYFSNNGIVYSVNSDGSYTIEECLPSRGLLVGTPDVSLSSDENLGKVSVIKEGAFEDCDYINFVDLTKTAGLIEIPKNCFRACDKLSRIHLPATVNSIEEGAFAGANLLNDLRIPGKEVFISGDAFSADGKETVTIVRTSEDSSARRYVDTYGSTYLLTWEKKDDWLVIFLDADFNQVGDEQIIPNGGYATIPPYPEKEDWEYTGWLGTNNADPKDPITEDTTFIARGYSTNSMVEGKYVVDFMDQIDGTIFNTQLVEPGKDAVIPQAPTHAGYTFVKYGGDSLTNIQKNSVALAMYSGGAGVNGGNGNDGANGSNGSTVSGNSVSSTSSGVGGKYTVTVINGSGSGTYDAGATVIITASEPATGKRFSKWTTESAGVTLASVSLSATTFVMPANNVTVTANYVNGSSSNSTTGTSTNGNTGNKNNGGTRVDITKPGISNKDLATATVNGSTDDFVVKISETPEATQAVINALTNKYGSLDSVLYYAMDISLYDSTGTVKISDTTGLTVDITIPIPDALTVFGGNNMAGAVVSNQLEDLSERFSTINGVPCISFTATHFSPYTVYVNTQQLSDGSLDITPKTGDPIHPKWFLSLGLACLSIILFMKKDKKPVKVKAA